MVPGADGSSAFAGWCPQIEQTAYSLTAHHRGSNLRKPKAKEGGWMSRLSMFGACFLVMLGSRAAASVHMIATVMHREVLDRIPPPVCNCGLVREGGCGSYGCVNGSCVWGNYAPGHDCWEFGQLCAHGTCDGQGNCGGVSPRPAGTVCWQGSAANCTGDAVCDGSDPYCPENLPAAPGTVCRASSGDPCDLGAVCDGSSNSCPANRPAASGTGCRSGSARRLSSATETAAHPSGSRAP